MECRDDLRDYVAAGLGDSDAVLVVDLCRHRDYDTIRKRTICRLARDPCEGLPVKDRGGVFPSVTG
jgi:hypothetical protein